MTHRFVLGGMVLVLGGLWFAGTPAQAQTASDSAQILIIIPERQDRPTAESVTADVVRSSREAGPGVVEADLVQDGDAAMIRYTRIAW